MADIRQAAQQALEALRYGKPNKAITILREALEQPEQEPVAWMFQHNETGRMNYVSNDGANTPELFLKGNPRYALVCPLYTASPAAQRPWVGLTEDEILEAAQIDAPDTWLFETAYAIEAKLKELNNG
jgi:hypothetical protein